MESLWRACMLLSIIFFGTVHSITPSKMEIYDGKHERANRSSSHLIDGDKDPACYIEPKWSLCKYHFIKWHREYRWRAYYDPGDDECYYYRGCPASNVELFTFDIDCRHACLSEPKKLLLQAPKLQHKSEHNIASLKLTKPHGHHQERRQKKESPKPDLCFRSGPIKAKKKSCKEAITKRAFFDQSKKRCYYFFDCGNAQKEYWSSVVACNKDCGGRTKKNHLQIEFSSKYEKNLWKNFDSPNRDDEFRHERRHRKA